MKNLIFILFLLSSSTWATDAIRSYKVDANPKILKIISERFEIVQKLSNGYEVFVKEEDRKAFLKLAPKAILIDANIHSWANQKAFGNYKKFINVEKDLIDFKSNYKDMAKLITYGQSSEQRKLYALKIDTQVNQNKKPELMITAATHGDELVTVEVLLALMQEIFSQYGKDPRITKMLDNHIIYFIPVVSPDSFESRSRYLDGQDPNRSYPWPEKPKVKTIPVIQSLIDFTHSITLAGSIDLHAYGKLVMYPWGYTNKAPNKADEIVMNDLVTDMARDNQYTSGQISTTIYVAKGNSADYYYWNQKTRAIAVEIGDSKVPNYSKIPQLVDESREMIYRFIENFN